ncbi:MAG: DUF669 domain-containing protein [Planctomycetota bacterium]|nr:DUF669 domain-containing protein [Planctomycetota bacterium]
MRFDFSNVDDVESFVSVPAGLYPVRVAEVREGRSRDGSTRWTFRLEVLDGDHAGRTAAWDSLTWSERGIYRVKKVLAALGIDVRGEVEVESKDLVGLRAQVLVQPEEREDPISGKRQVRMRVPYLGYEPLADGARPDITGAEDPGVDGWDDGEDAGTHEPTGKNGRPGTSGGAPF